MSKIWLVTGSASGLGRVISEAALDAGHQVVATARNPDQLKGLAERYGSRVRIASLDVNNEAEGGAAVRLAVQEFGRLDVLINNAGYGDTRPFEQVPSAAFRGLVETCFFGVVNLTRAALPVMRLQRSGHIIQISSLGGRTAFPGNAAYFAAKWAVGGFTEGVALETAHLGIKITALEPWRHANQLGPASTRLEGDLAAGLRGLRRCHRKKHGALLGQRDRRSCPSRARHSANRRGRTFRPRRWLALIRLIHPLGPLSGDPSPAALRRPNLACG